MRWLSFEKRWRDTLFAAMIPPAGGRPGIESVNLGEFWETAGKKMPPLAAIGLRAAVWILTLLPLVTPGYWGLFNRLSPDLKDGFLTGAQGSKWYLVRQMVMAIKTFAAFGYFADPGIRKQFGVNP